MLRGWQDLPAGSVLILRYFTPVVSSAHTDLKSTPSLGKKVK